MADEYIKKNADLINEVAKQEGLGEVFPSEKADEKMSMKERVQEIVGKLEQGIKEVFESDKYKEYLNTMAKFHNYSINNVLLINQQKPEATLVAGYNSWSKNFNRHVNKGERAIKILAPYEIKNNVLRVAAVDGAALSIGIVRADVSEGSIASMILDSLVIE